MATTLTSICLFVAVSCRILTSVPSPKDKKKIRRAVLVVVFFENSSVRVLYEYSVTSGRFDSV